MMLWGRTRGAGRQLSVAWWLMVAGRKMSCATGAVMSAVRLGPVTASSGKANEAIYVQPSKACSRIPLAVLVVFGGDIQDYPEVMAAHRDHKHYVDWSLTTMATLLASKFPAHHVLVIKPCRMERKTFSCYDNFVSSNSVGAPTHDPGITALTHLATLIPQALRKAQAWQTSTRDEFPADQSCERNNIDESSQSSCVNSPHEWDTPNDQHCASDFPNASDYWLRRFEELNIDEITLLGFSKGCVVLNQVITELHGLMTVGLLHSKLLAGFVDKVHSMYWLDGGHAGGRNTWITSPTILKSLAAQQHINIHIHVTPYQVRDEFRPWIGKECKSFYDILRRAGARVNYCLHFKEEPPSLLSHFKVLNNFI
ncbi:UPF0565 protein C2orf69 [Chionoecetes opilio]|uniref:UPF0565 protein C2orf69 n=1 Tax=Chionoecetes opilio TaxID=41210 RepID=A0A8J4XTW1_CHIOP|nr:UPF0565 protein C2orf69 [Chionoecetes opilio]